MIHFTTTFSHVPPFFFGGGIWLKKCFDFRNQTPPFLTTFHLNLCTKNIGLHCLLLHTASKVLYSFPCTLIYTGIFSQWWGWFEFGLTQVGSIWIGWSLTGDIPPSPLQLVRLSPLSSQKSGLGKFAGF